MFESTKKTLLKLTFAAIFIGGLTTFAAAQTDHINLEEGLPTQLEDAYPTAATAAPTPFNINKTPTYFASSR